VGVPLLLVLAGVVVRTTICMHGFSPGISFLFVLLGSEDFWIFGFPSSLAISSGDDLI